MAARILSVFARQAVPRDWSAQDAEFYRVESALIQAGLHVTSERGLSDEGDPWFVFCREEDDEVIIHFARIDGRYVISAPAYCGTAVGVDFRTLVRSMMQRHPVLQPKPARNNLLLHPSAMLVLLVATALLKTGHAEAATVRSTAAGASPAEWKLRGSTSDVVTPAEAHEMVPEAQHETLILAALNVLLASPMSTPGIAPAAVVAGLPMADSSTPPHVADAVDHVLGLSSPDAPLAGAGSLTPAPVVATNAPEGGLIHMAQLALQAPVVAGVEPVGLLPPAITMPVVVSPQATTTADPTVNAATQSVVTFAVSSLPQAEQDLLHALGGTGQVSNLSALPLPLTMVVNSGPHTAVHSEAHVAAADATPTPALQTAPATMDAGTGTAAASQPAAAASAAAPPPPSGLSDMSVVLANVQEFRAEVPHTALAIAANYIVVYDSEAVITHINLLQSVTYDLAGGFSVSLVGVPSELAHLTSHV